jgi:hypothetical protein
MQPDDDTRALGQYAHQAVVRNEPPVDAGFARVLSEKDQTEHTRKGEQSEEREEPVRLSWRDQHRPEPLGPAFGYDFRPEQLRVRIHAGSGDTPAFCRDISICVHAHSTTVGVGVIGVVGAGGWDGRVRALRWLGPATEAAGIGPICTVAQPLLPFSLSGGGGGGQ